MSVIDASLQCYWFEIQVPKPNPNTSQKRKETNSRETEKEVIDPKKTSPSKSSGVGLHPISSHTDILFGTSSTILSTPENVLATTTMNSISRIYQTARVFVGDTSYTFRIQRQGRHWIRLHFFPFVYQGYNMSSASFSVTTQQFVLLDNFNVNSGTLLKEFSVNITTNDLVLRFVPSGNSFAFLNALEVVSVPDELITNDATPNPVGNFQGLSRQALETVHRVNMGGPLITSSNDTLGRTWVPDQPFLLTLNLVQAVSNVQAVNYVPGGPTSVIAPNNVYGTAAEMRPANVTNSNFNVTWEFDVVPGFDYLIRFHFCDIVSTALNQLLFNVYIFTQLVVGNLDLSTKTSNLAAPYYVDYIVTVSDMRRLTVSIGPSAGADPNAILNGLEVMKMNNSRGSLDGGSFVPSPPKSKSQKKVGLVVGIVVGLVVLIAVALIVVMMKTTPTFPSFKNMGPFYDERRRKFFEYGKGSRDGTKIAAKRGNPQSSQGLAEFRTEIEMLSQFRHRHLVSLIGLDWKQRLEICIGSCEGLHYLHTGSSKAVIHRDVKSANILLDENLMAKVADFGFLKLGQKLIRHTKFGETAEKCLAEYGVDRPSMADVLWNLEYALQLQEAANQGDPYENSTNQIGEISPLVNNANFVETGANFEEFSAIDDLSGTSMSKVFSQLVKAEGRLITVVSDNLPDPGTWGAMGEDMDLSDAIFYKIEEIICKL
ncbi:hypothetical protein IFM89_015024 [Coptis chinensis]|uniref:Protein kinase domain-containing protein n=1 Tax=Coptis chinensis TaxID=261450 RepID=A0A835HME4_9MAGN|nr:hypothetical protein IFM89_015024 [Coptis chinensis]